MLPSTLTTGAYTTQFVTALSLFVVIELQKL